jgi:hypothetical protein
MIKMGIGFAMGMALMYAILVAPNATKRQLQSGLATASSAVAEGIASAHNEAQKQAIKDSLPPAPTKTAKK